MDQKNLRVIVIGGGAAGISAASMAKTVAPEASVTLFTEYEDVAYSPCGIPFVHGKEIPDFERLFLQTSEHPGTHQPAAKNGTARKQHAIPTAVTVFGWTRRFARGCSTRHTSGGYTYFVRKSVAPL